MGELADQLGLEERQLPQPHSLLLLGTQAVQLYLLVVPVFVVVLLEEAAAVSLVLEEEVKVEVGVLI